MAKDILDEIAEMGLFSETTSNGSATADRWSPLGDRELIVNIATCMGIETITLEQDEDTIDGFERACIEHWDRYHDGIRACEPCRIHNDGVTGHLI